jgi:hypothetical protein
MNAKQIKELEAAQTSETTRKLVALLTELRHKTYQLLSSLTNHKRIACATETEFLISLVFDVLTACRPRSSIPHLVSLLQVHVSKLKNILRLKELINFWFRQTVACFCSYRVQSLQIPRDIIAAIHHLIAAMAEAYPDLERRLVRTAAHLAFADSPKTEELTLSLPDLEQALSTTQGQVAYQHNCRALKDYFVERPWELPVLCSEVDR